MSIYKPTLLDKFKDFVNGLKSNWDAYEGHVEDFETAKGIITDTFDETRTYAVGDYAIYENVLYKCVEAIEEAGEWDADKWAATNIAEEFESHQAEFANQLGSNGYQKFPGGIVLQWGQAIVPANAGYVDVTLPIAFPSTIRNVQATVNYMSSGEGGAGGNQLNKIVTPQYSGNTAITLYIRNPDLTNPNIDIRVDWQALGY
jgi:hypothetical protein